MCVWNYVATYKHTHEHPNMLLLRVKLGKICSANAIKQHGARTGNETKTHLNSGNILLKKITCNFLNKLYLKE